MCVCHLAARRTLGGRGIRAHPEIHLHCSPFRHQKSSDTSSDTSSDSEYVFNPLHSTLPRNETTADTRVRPTVSRNEMLRGSVKAASSTGPRTAASLRCQSIEEGPVSTAGVTRRVVRCVMRCVTCCVTASYAASLRHALRVTGCVTASRVASLCHVLRHCVVRCVKASLSRSIFCLLQTHQI